MALIGNIKDKIKALVQSEVSLNNKNKAFDQIQEATGVPIDEKQREAIIKANVNPELLLAGFTIKRIKDSADSARASGLINQLQQPGGLEKTQAQFPSGVKASQGGLSVEVKPKKKSENSEKAEDQSQAIYRFAQQFDRSYQELKKFDPEIDKLGVGGFLTRKAATVATAIDALPETKALQITVLPLAQEIASELEGGRVTDQDRKIQADKFASAVKFPTKSNIRLLANNYIDLIDKGGDENGKISSQLKLLLERKSDIFNSVIEQVLTEFPEKAKDIFGEDYEVVQ